MKLGIDLSVKELDNGFTLTGHLCCTEGKNQYFDIEEVYTNFSLVRDRVEVLMTKAYPVKKRIS